MPASAIIVLALNCFAAAPAADEPSPSYNSTDVSVAKLGDKVAGRIGACMVGQGKKPRMCFGLSKEIDGDPQFTFVMLFRTGPKNCNPSGSASEFSADGMTTKIKKTYHLGEFKLPMTLEYKTESNKITDNKVVIGDIELSGKKPGIVIVDLTGDKPTFKHVKLDLPKCKVDLTDADHKTWMKAIDDAIAELKHSKDVDSFAD